MSKLHEKNFSFTAEPTNEKSVLSHQDKKVKVVGLDGFTFFSDKDVQNKKKIIKVIDITLMIINIVTNVAFIFFMGDMLNGFSYAGALGYTFTTTRLIGLIIFLIAQVTGLYLTIKFFLKQNLKIRLILISAPLTFLLVGGVWLFYNLNNINITKDISASQAIGIDSSFISLDFKFILLAVAIYLVILYFSYSGIFKQSNASKVANQKPKN